MTPNTASTPLSPRLVSVDCAVSTSVAGSSFTTGNVDVRVDQAMQCFSMLGDITEFAEVGQVHDTRRMGHQ